MDEDDIWLGDRLPTIYDVAQTIFHYAKTLNSNKRRGCSQIRCGGTKYLD